MDCACDLAGKKKDKTSEWAEQRGKDNRLISGQILDRKTFFKSNWPGATGQCYCQTLLVGLILIMKINDIYSSQDTALFGASPQAKLPFTSPDCLD